MKHFLTGLWAIILFILFATFTVWLMASHPYIIGGYLLFMLCYILGLCINGA